MCQKKVRLFPACRCREGSPAQTSQQYAWPILILNRNTIHILKSVQPVCSLASITGTTVLPHVIDHANPVETFSKLSKSCFGSNSPGFRQIQNCSSYSHAPFQYYCTLKCVFGGDDHYQQKANESGDHYQIINGLYKWSVHTAGQRHSLFQFQRNETNNQSESSSANLVTGRL